MLTLGCHLSTSGGFEAMAKRAASIDANTFAYFTRNPRGGSSKEPDPEDLRRFSVIARESGIGALVAHAPYTLNLCSAKPDVREFARMAMRQDLERMELLPGNFYNFHPGSHVGQGVEEGIALIAEGLNSSLVPGQTHDRPS